MGALCCPSDPLVLWCWFWYFYFVYILSLYPYLSTHRSLALLARLELPDTVTDHEARRPIGAGAAIRAEAVDGLHGLGLVPGFARAGRTERRRVITADVRQAQHLMCVREYSRVKSQTSSALVWIFEYYGVRSYT